MVANASNADAPFYVAVWTVEAATETATETETDTVRAVPGTAPVTEA